MKVMRAPDLVSRWSDQGEMLALPGRRSWLKLTPELRGLLEDAARPVERDDLGGDEDAADRVVDQLLDLQVLVPAVEASSPADVTPELWRHWGTLARRFHTECRDANYLVGGPRRAEVAEEIATSSPAPASYKSYPDAPVVMLPRVPQRLDVAFDAVLAARRTHRVFTDDELGLDQLSTLLLYSFSPLRHLGAGDFGHAQGRASASAGGRHEVEAYVVVHAVEGVPPGLYHYAPDRHCLELLDPTVDRSVLAPLVHDQDASTGGAITVLTTAVAARLAWKYRHPRAYRLWMYDAGHYGQTFALTATALGLGPFQTVAFSDSAIERLLGVDGEEEFAVYLLGAGVPRPTTGSLPADLPHPVPQEVR